ncbi:MAG: carboxypeptidase-like regulatory domain-containing protein, partial [Patescibacteria group bacterium]
DNNIVTFVSLLSQPADFSFNLATGVISGRPSSEGQYALKVAVKDNLEATNEASYSLDVYTYCGDGEKQSPNGEMPSANEQCDGAEGTPANAACKADCTWRCNSDYHQDGQNIACVSNTSPGCTLITPDVNAVDTVKSWTGSAWSGCKIRSCKDENLNTGYHLNVNTNECDPNWQNCTVTTGTSNASSLEQYWIKSSSTWGGCIIKSCNSGFHLDNNNCVSSIRNCAITNASSAQDIWTNNAWTGCKVVSCNNRFFNNGNNSCISTELLDACNMLNASSTHQFWSIGTNIWGPCEIISCRSGYFLNNNICVQNFIISGNVKNVMTLAPIADADIQIRDSNNNTVETARTNALGNYFVNIDIPGNNNYNVIIIRAGFEQGDSGSFLLDRNAIKNFGLGSLSSGVARIVLSWGDSPRDLDARLDFFGFQVSYLQNNLSRPNTLKIGAGATLNTDVLYGFGPEVITISALVAGGDYGYSVKNSSNNNKMNAKVEVFNASGFKVREYLSGDSTTLWNVFQMTDMGIIL